MKRIALILALLLFAGPAFAASVATCGIPGTGGTACLTYTSGASGISVTQTNTIIGFSDNKSSGSGSGFCATTILVISRTASANTCYLNFDQTVASSTLDIPLAPGAAITRVFSAPFCRTGMGVICASSNTATFDIVAQP